MRSRPQAGALRELADPSRRRHTALVEQTATDEIWAAQIGAALTEDDAARLLGLTPAEVSQAADLLRIRDRDGRLVYPLMQFDTDRAQLPGIAEVVHTLATLQLLTIASWLTTPNPVLHERPVDTLRAGDVEPVLQLARQLAAESRG